jgi:predicted transposase/invertase (TIGR01784 family)
MKSKKEANQYDKIFKENLESVTMALIEKVLHIQVAHYEKMPLELQRTLERKPDQLLKITDTQGNTFLLQLEFQLIDEPDMVYRMLEYRAILMRKYKLEVRQYVLFLSDAVPAMPTRIEQPNLSFGFELVQLSQVDYELFLSSDKADEVVFAVLGNFGTADPQQAASRILDRLTRTSPDALELNRHLQQLWILANLRKLSPFIEQIMESITKYFKEEDDYFFKKGEQIGKQEGLLEGKQKGKQEAILKFLKDGILTTKQLASYFDVTEAFVENLRNQLS